MPEREAANPASVCEFTPDRAYGMPEVLECVPVPIVVIDADTRIHTANRAFCVLTGSQPGALEGSSFAELAKTLWGIGSITDKLVGIGEDVPCVSFEFDHGSSGLKARSYVVTAQHLGGKSGMYLLTLEDITLRREAERLIALRKQELENEAEFEDRILKRTRQELRELTGRLFIAQEEERQRVARDLHDDIGQRLSLLQILLSEFDSSTWTRDEASRLASIKCQLNDLNEDVREISHRLHPAILNDLGLSTALRSLVDTFSKREQVPVVFVAQELPCKVSAAAETALYRITQEALRNIARHAGATHAEVCLDATEAGIRLRITDFGVGFDPSARMQPGPALGLISMQERAHIVGGTLRIESSPGNGTTVEVHVPMQGYVCADI